MISADGDQRAAAGGGEAEHEADAHADEHRGDLVARLERSIVVALALDRGRVTSARAQHRAPMSSSAAPTIVSSVSSNVSLPSASSSARARTRRRARPGSEPTASHSAIFMSTVPQRKWRQPPTRLRDGGVGEVGADRRRRRGAEDEDQRGVISEPPPTPVVPTSTPTKKPNRMMSGQSSRSVRLDGGQPCSPHSSLSLPAQRPLRSAPATVQCVQPIDA